MSDRDVEVVSRIYEAFAGHRFPEELLDEGFEWTTHPGLPDAGSYRGREAVRRFFSGWVAGWADVRNQPRELIDAGERVVALIHGRFRLTDDSEPFENDYGHIWTIKSGKALACRAVELDRALELAPRPSRSSRSDRA